MKTLIVATDFSKEAENAVEYAGAAAKYLGAKVILFNSFNMPVHLANSLLPASSIEEVMKQNNLLLKERAQKLAEEYSIQADYESGLLLEVSDELDEIIARHKADLVVMGMASHSLAQDIFGNTTTSAITKLKFPVLAIPFGATFKGVHKILFACEMLRGVHKNILDQIRNLAILLDAEIEIFHVRDKITNMEKRKAGSSVKNIGKGFSGVTHYYKNVDSEEVIEEIENEIKYSEADLLIMVPYRYGFWASLIHRSKTRIMASNSSIPLLSIPV